MQVFWTIVSGVIVYVVGQAILHFIFEPIKEFNKQRSDTSFLLLFHQAKITNASNMDQNVQKDLKEMGPSLISTMKQIPFYQFLTMLGVFGLPPEEAVFRAVRELNGLAYGMGPIGRETESAVDNTKALESIARLLRIQTGYS